jgi:hypothetical protein
MTLFQWYSELAVLPSGREDDKYARIDNEIHMGV